MVLVPEELVGCWIMWRQLFFTPVPAAKFFDAQRFEATLQIGAADLEQQPVLLHQVAPSFEDTGAAIPDMGTFRTGTVGFDDSETLTLLDLGKIGEADVVATKIKFRQALRDVIETRFHLRRHQMVTVSEDGAATMTAGKRQAYCFTGGGDAVEPLGMTAQIKMLQFTGARIGNNEFAQTALAIAVHIREIFQRDRDDAPLRLMRLTAVKDAGLAFKRYVMLQQQSGTAGKLLQIAQQGGFGANQLHPGATAAQIRLGHDRQRQAVLLQLLQCLGGQCLQLSCRGT